MIFFAILFLALNAACKAKTEFELTDCNEGEDLCFDVENGDEMDTLVLFAQGGNNYKGFMEDSNIQAFASSQDGENFEISMYDERFPGAPFLVSKKGHNIEQFGNENRRNNTDMVMFPPVNLLPPPSKKGPIDMRANIYPAAGFDIHIIFKYDNNFLAEFGANVESRINAIVGHANILFQFPTLNAKMTLIIDAIEHYDGVVIASENDLKKLRNKVLPLDPSSPDLFAFMTFQVNPSFIGIAWIGSVCFTDENKGYRNSINHWFVNDTYTAETLAHEIGHNLNMEHDFDAYPGNAKFCSTGEGCTDIGGVMDYYQQYTRWTCCSNENFASLYAYNDRFCLSPTKPCKNKEKTKKCKKLKKKGKCSKKWAWRKCKKTCNRC